MDTSKLDAVINCIKSSIEDLTLPLSSLNQPGFDLEMSVTLDKEFSADLNNPLSSTYKELESKINLVLKDGYRGISGFFNVFVKAFRQGSVITDYVVQMTEFANDEIAGANKQLPTALGSVAPVIGNVAASYKSPAPIKIPAIIYTGDRMTFTCGPPSIQMGQISASEWTFNGQKIKKGTRFEITSGSISKLTVNNVILADIGTYECALRGQTIDFIQVGQVTNSIIREAPVVRLQSRVNADCQERQFQELQCCVQLPYKVKWFQDATILPSTVTNNRNSYCIKHDYEFKSCSTSEQTKFFTCTVDQPAGYKGFMSLIIFKGGISCQDDRYGTGREEDTSTIGCEEGLEGSSTAVCRAGKWQSVEDTCIVTAIKELLIFSEQLTEEGVPEFADNLNAAVQNNKSEIVNSSSTISAIVSILNTISNVSPTVTQTVMKDVLETVDIIISEDSRDSWIVLNRNETLNSSSKLLGSLEDLSDRLTGEFEIVTERIKLNKTSFDTSFAANLNSSININISDTASARVSITTMILSTLNNVMPARNKSFTVSLAPTNETEADNAINGAVVLVKINTTNQNITLSFDKLNNSLRLNPQCVFWNFAIFDDLGAWDDEGCMFLSDINNIVTCSCNHLTSFSILMATGIPQNLIVALDIITYVGVGISLASLVICLIIEGYVWKAITRNSTAFMRHVSIINTALSLLIADICFIIAASFAKNPLENPGEDYQVPVGPCSAATFFMHLFYLALFFWMLVSGLLLFYRTVMVFSNMSKSVMLAIGFCLGYGCPLIIAVVTVAVTAAGGGYIQKNEACWLNWLETKALLALVIPALTIVLINILILIVIIVKILRRGVGESVQTDDKHTLAVIARCVIILTPLFGLTWSLGVGTIISSTNEGIHIAFAFFNSLQGFFILVFGTLLDSKVRGILSKKSSTTTTGSNPTKSTSSSALSVRAMEWINRLRRRRYVYHVSQAANSSSGASESYSII